MVERDPVTRSERYERLIKPLSKIFQAMDAALREDLREARDLPKEWEGFDNIRLRIVEILEGVENLTPEQAIEKRREWGPLFALPYEQKRNSTA